LGTYPLGALTVRKISCPHPGMPCGFDPSTLFLGSTFRSTTLSRHKFNLETVVEPKSLAYPDAGFPLKTCNFRCRKIYFELRNVQ